MAVQKQKWTSEEVDILRKMAADGASPPVIAHFLNRSKNSVIGRASRLGINFTFLRRQFRQQRADVGDGSWVA